MSNNPFAANDPNTQNILNPFNQDPSQRFPSINDQNQQQPQIQYAPPMQQQQQQQQQQPQYGQVQQQQPTYMNPQATGFQPQSSFGQSLAYEMNSYSTIKDLDPYGSIPGTWAQHQQQPPRNGHSPSISSPSNNAYGAHPRTVVENNKNALERWDNSSWKLLFGKMDDLKRSWESRKRQILIALESQGGRMLGYEEQQRFQSLLKDADENIDQLVAADIQIREVEAGYRQSSDAPSRARVRHALNEALRSMPDWPEDLYTGPAAHTPIQQQYTSSYSPQQQQSMQPQMTGYSNPSYQQPYSNSLSPSTYLMPQYTSQAPTMMQPTYTGMPNQNQQYMQTGYPGQQYPQSWNPI